MTAWTRRHSTSSDWPPDRPKAESGYAQEPMQWSLVLQTLNTMQRELGALHEAVSTIKDKLDDQGKKTGRLQTIITFAGGAVAVLALVGGFLVDRLAGILDQGFENIIKALGAQ